LECDSKLRIFLCTKNHWVCTSVAEPELEANNKLRINFSYFAKCNPKYSEEVEAVLFFLTGTVDDAATQRKDL
jgi:hypothetical protein